MLVEIHMIQNHAPSNLNRDDTGSPKSCVFGGIRRARISSQCLKRSIRQSEIFQKEIEKMGKSFRTRLLPEKIMERLISDGIPESHARIVAKKISGLGSKKERKDSDEKLITKQIIFFSSGELDNIVSILKDKIKNETTPEAVEKSLKDFNYEKAIESSGHQSITPDIALFGRMVTSEAFPNIEASIQVAHALSTNKMEHEFDYFTAVDDLISTSETIEAQGAGMIGDTEFNSACYYKYFSLDFDSLIENMKLSGNSNEKELKSQLVDVASAFVKAAAFTTPTGKQNTFAAHQLPDAILIEIRKEKTPISYTNAFIKPARPKGDKDLLEVSLEKFTDYVKDINRKYGLTCDSRLWFTTKEIEIENVTNCENFEELTKNLKENLRV